MKFVRFERGIRGAVDATPAMWGALADDGETVRELSGAPYDETTETGVTYPIDEVRLLAPAAPANYSDTIGPNARLSLPPFVDTFTYQVGFALVIGRQVNAIGLSDTDDSIFGYTCFVRARAALTAYDVEQQPRNVILVDRLVLGPVLVSGSLANSAHLHIALNGDATLCAPDVKESVARALRDSLQAGPLAPGDLVLVATESPAVLSMAPGDVLTVEVANVGRLVTLCSRA